MKITPERREELDLLELTTLVPDHYLVEIGRVVANFAILEKELSSLIHCLLGTNEDVTQIVTSELSFRNLLDLSASLVKQLHSPKETELFKATLKLVEKAEEKRNLIVHSIWKVGFDWGVTRSKNTAKRGRGLQTQNEFYSLEDLQIVAVQIVRARRAVRIFRESLGCTDDLSY